MARVAFIITRSFDLWKGGLNYYRNLISAVADLPDKKVSPVIITEKHTDRSFLAVSRMLNSFNPGFLNGIHPTGFFAGP